MKKDKKYTPPLSVFAEKLKNAFVKPAAEPKNEIKAKDTSSSVVKPPQTTITKTESNFSKSPNLTYKISDAAPLPAKKPVIQNPTPLPVKKQLVQNPVQNPVVNKNKPVETPPLAAKTSSTPNKPKIAVAEEVKKTPPLFVEKVEIKSQKVPDNSQKYLTLMRQKFWENFDGEIRSGQRGRAYRVNLGIDLGTSFTKVAYRLGSSGDAIYPVRFGTNKNNIEDYLVPSVVVIGGKKIKCRFEIEDEEKIKKAAQIPNFKICLTCERGDVGETVNCSITKCSLSNLKAGYLPNEVKDEEASFLTAFYLAKLIARAKESVREHLSERQIQSDITIKWSANLAVPDKFLDSNVAEGFRESLEIGWLISEISSHPNLSDKLEMVTCYQAAKKLHAEIKQELLSQNKDFDCFTFSEIGAEAAAVTLSSTSEEGLYVLVDVGAGTVDTSVFRFRRNDGDPVQETYAANIFKLGAAQIDARANASFMRKSLNWLRQIKENVFHQKGEDALIHITQEIASAENSVSNELQEKLISVYREAYNKQKNIEIWMKLILIMGGGGSAIKSYGETARKAFSPKTLDAKPIEFSNLKVPGDFQMETLPTSQFHRFAVAYGLSHDGTQLPDLVASTKVLPVADLRKKIYIDPTNDG